jgi:hypothetical protein
MQSRASDRERSRVAELSSSSLIRASLILLVAGATLLLAGCGPRRVRADFTSYENSYAVTSNHEELLNLARLQQHDPTYFFKLGQISSSYRMEAALTGTGQLSTVSSPPATTVPTGGGSPTFLYENDPSFTLIPVNDDTNASILLKPVDSTVFYSLYLQGWRLDQLIRLTVNRIELTVPVPPDPAHPDQKAGCKVEVIRNLPPPGYDAKNNYANDGFSLASYITFLRVNAVIYALQKHGLLLLRGTNSFEPLDSASYIPSDTGNGKPSSTGDPKAGAGGDPPASNSETHPASSGAPTAKEFDEVAAKGQVWELQPADTTGKWSKWVLGVNAIEPQFQLTSRTRQESAATGWAQECKVNTGPGSANPCEPDYGQNVQTIKELLLADFRQNDSGMEELLGNNDGEGPDLTEILEILYNGFSIEESSAEQQSEKELCATGSNDRIAAHLVMRSLIGLMAAAAQEQESFEQLEQTNPDAPLGQVKVIVDDTFKGAYLAATRTPANDTQVLENDALIKLKGKFRNAPTFRDVVPEIEQLPVLKLTWADGEMANAQHSKFDLATLGLAVHYKGQNYLVTDLKPPGSPNSPFVLDNQYWNRDMFRLINELSSQVSVDISKFPLPEVLQLRTE